jgi:hypothetical protein
VLVKWLTLLLHIQEVLGSSLGPSDRLCWLRLQTLHKSKAVPLPQCKFQRGEKVQCILILDIGTRWGDWSASQTLCPLLPGKVLHFPLYRRLLSLRAGLDSEARGKILCLFQGWKPVVQSVVRHYTDWATWAAIKHYMLLKIWLYSSSLICLYLL